MRFVDFLRSTVLLSAAAATALATICILASSTAGSRLIAPVAIGWWVLAAVIGLRIGRAQQASGPIARLLASAKATTTLPEHHPSAILVNRLWPLFVFTLLSGGLAFLAPQIPGIGAGFAIIWALAWRRQDAAVAAIEERDGACFYVQRASAVRPMTLVRTPGFAASRPENTNGAVT